VNPIAVSSKSDPSVFILPWSHLLAFYILAVVALLLRKNLGKLLVPLSLGWLKMTIFGDHMLG
jgi:hypothetical protein